MSTTTEFDPAELGAACGQCLILFARLIIERKKMPSDDEIRQILNGPAITGWMKLALTTALERDPVDAVNDAELLAIVLKHRSEGVVKDAMAEIEPNRVIWRARNESSGIDV